MKDQDKSPRDDYEDEGFMVSATECTGLVPFSAGDDVEMFAEIYSEVYGFPAPRVDIKGKKIPKKEKNNER